MGENERGGGLLQPRRLRVVGISGGDGAGRAWRRALLGWGHVPLMFLDRRVSQSPRCRRALKYLNVTQSYGHCFPPPESHHRLHATG